MGVRVGPAHVVTLSSLVTGAASITVQPLGGKRHAARVIETDRKKGAALLKMGQPR